MAKRAKHFVLVFEPMLGNPVSLVLTRGEFDKGEKRYNKWIKLGRIA
jgi:hypothetical protein